MRKLKPFIFNTILFLQVLLLFLFFFQDRIQLPVWLQVVGRLHPVVLHMPIGLLVFLVVIIILRTEFRKKAFHRIVLITLLLISLSASFSALAGLFLSVQGDYRPESLQQHQNAGVVLTVLCYLLLLTYNKFKKRNAILYSGVVFAILILVFTGHTGATLTHGENYLLEPITHARLENKTLENSSLYKFAVEPVLKKKCFSCHNTSKAKGGLVMTNIEGFIKGGKNGAAWVKGNPDSSRMIRYIHLPLEHDNHMPPEGKPQLTAVEVLLLASWIKAGADFERKYEEFDDQDTLRVLVSTLSNSEAKKVVRYPFKAVSAEVLAKLNTPFRTVFPLYQNSAALQADFFVKESFQSSTLTELKEVKDQLVVLNLSKMPVSDAELSVIGQFKNLEKLNLNFTLITGDGLRSLVPLSKLTSISLAGTSVSKSAVMVLLGMPGLRKVFIWNTPITKGEVTELKGAYPSIEFIHTLANDTSLLALSKPRLVNEGIIRQDEPLELKHTMPEVTIRYTLDGSMPDSISGIVYEKPIAASETLKLKALACKPGWYCSNVMDITCYVEGHKPAQVVLLTPADKQYPGEGASSLTDGRNGFTDVLKEPSWLGFRDHPFEAGFDFGSLAPAIHKVVLSYGDNLGGYVFPPTVVEVWGGKNAKEIRLIKSLKIEQPITYRPQSKEFIAVSFDSTNYPYYKIVAKPVSKLPLWHGGKGQKGWFFVDEVFFY